MYNPMHEYDSLSEKHKTLKTWCKIKSDTGAEYWVNKDDFDFKSKDGSNIGVVFYDKWDDFFEEIEPEKYGTYRCEKEKQDAFVNDYKLNELGINTVQDIPSNSKEIKKFYYNAESEWSDNQKITDEYVNLSPIQKSETTEYRKDQLSYYMDEIKIGKKIAPGDIVGYVGGSGASGLSAYSPHLHISYYNYDKGDITKELLLNRIYTKLEPSNDTTMYIRNPINHKVKKDGNKKL